MHVAGVTCTNGSGKAWAETLAYDLGCKQNLGPTVKDLFDLRMEEQTSEKDRESVATNGVSRAGEKALEQGKEYRQGESKHDQPSSALGTTNYMAHQVNHIIRQIIACKSNFFPPIECTVRINFPSAHGCRVKLIAEAADWLERYRQTLETNFQRLEFRSNLFR